MNNKVKVYATRGCGSALVEAFLTLGGIAYERIELDYSTPGPLLDELLRLNPLGQVPTLLMPDSSVLTESLAVAHWAGGGLVPSEGIERQNFLRWSTFIVAAIYPTFTYGDDPKMWNCGAELKAATDQARKQYWLQMEAAALEPYFLGNTFSVIDIYLKVMSHWRPGAAWFKEATPKLAAIAARVSEDARLKKIWELNF